MPPIDEDSPRIDIESAPRRFKTIDELTPGEHAERQAGGELPETEDFREYRRQVNERYGLEDTKPAEDDPAAHARRKYGA